MAVADWSYRRWTGQPTSYAARTLAITRQALSGVFSRRIAIAAYVACLLPAIGLAIAAYVSVNLKAIMAAYPGLAPLGAEQFVGPDTYRAFIVVQGWFIVFWTLVAGPTLVSRDLANNALALYLSKSIRVRDYVLGKWAALVLLLSGVSWLPLLLAFGLQWSLSDAAWRERNGWIGPAILVVDLPLIAVLTGVVTAVSAHVRRRLFAQAVFVGVFVVTFAFAGVMSAMLRTVAAEVVSPMIMTARLADWAFAPPGHVAVLGPWVTLPALAAWVAVAVAVLVRRLKPVEVVK